MFRACAFFVTFVSLVSLAHAWPRPRRGTRHRHRVRVSNDPIVTVLHSERASERDARATLASHFTVIRDCLARARERDAAALAQLRFIDVTVRLDAQGSATLVELDPPLMTRGLSSCLATNLLDWRQPPPLAPRASVFFRIEVGR
jgi:hypothetical protein